MRLSTNKWLLTGALTVVAGLAVYFVGFTELLSVAPSGPVNAAAPKPKTKPRTPRRPAVVPRSLLPQMAPDEELVIVSETPVEWSAPVPAQPAAGGQPKIQYFGATAEDIRALVPRGRGGSATGAPKGPDPIGDALRALAKAQSKQGCVHVASGGRVSESDCTALALLAWAKNKSVRAVGDFDANIKSAAAWLAGKQDAFGLWRAADGTDDYTATALVVLALEAAQLKAYDAQLKLAREALAVQVLSSGGWPARRGGTLDALATLFVMQGREVPASATHATVAELRGRYSALDAEIWGGTASRAHTTEAALLILDRSSDTQWMASQDRTQTQKTLSALTFDWNKEQADLLLWWLSGQRIALDANAHRGALSRLWNVLSDAQHSGTWSSNHSTIAGLSYPGTTALGALTLLSLLEGASRVAAERNAASPADRDGDGTGDALDAMKAAKHQSGPGWLRHKDSDLVLPLKHTDVAASISGIVASTRVTQTFANPGSSDIEAVYCFPLPHSAAVTDFEMRIGKRRIRGVIRPRADAEQLYAQAVAEGRTAALLTRETAGIFNHQMGRIPAATNVDIELTFFNRVGFADGRFEWVFPMVVGPFYVPGIPVSSAGGRPGYGVSPDTDQAPNASRITPPSTPEGMRSGHDINITIDLDAGFQIAELACVTHSVSTEFLGPGQRIVRLDSADRIANRDFVLRWKSVAPPGGSVLMAHKPDPEAPGWFCLLLNPAQSGIVRTGGDVVFVVDISGSMNGAPIDTSKRVVAEAIQALSPGDRFNVITFASGTSQLFSQPEIASPANVKKGLEMVAALESGGGTEVLQGLKTAVNERRLRGEPCQFVFLTDGYVANIEEILAFVKANTDTGEFCAFGIGSSVNRELIDGIAAASNGRAVYCLPRDAQAVEGAVAAFHQFLRVRPTPEISLDWGELPVSEIAPGRLEVMQAGTTTALFGRYAYEAEGTLRLSASDRGDWLVNIELPGHDERHPGVRALWAQTLLSDRQALLDVDPVRRKTQIEELTAFAARERLATLWTAFVAVDEERRVTTGKPRTVVQPVELPEGVDRKGSGR